MKRKKFQFKSLVKKYFLTAASKFAFNPSEGLVIEIRAALTISKILSKGEISEFSNTMNFNKKIC